MNILFFFGSAQDHKRVGEGDTGSKYWWDGCIFTANILNHELEKKIKKDYRTNTKFLRKNDHPYKVILYIQV